MLFKRKGQAAGQLPEEKSLYPVLHVAMCSAMATSSRPSS